MTNQDAAGTRIAHALAEHGIGVRWSSVLTLEAFLDAGQTAQRTTSLCDTARELTLKARFLRWQAAEARVGDRGPRA